MALVSGSTSHIRDMAYRSCKTALGYVVKVDSNSSVDGSLVLRSNWLLSYVRSLQKAFVSCNLVISKRSIKNYMQANHHMAKRA